MREDIGWAENVIRNCPFAGQLKQQEFDALVDFVFNVGTGQPGHKDGFVWLRNGNHSTMYSELVGGDHAGAANEFPKRFVDSCSCVDPVEGSLPVLWAHALEPDESTQKAATARPAV